MSKSRVMLGAVALVICSGSVFADSTYVSNGSIYVDDVFSLVPGDAWEATGLFADDARAHELQFKGQVTVDDAGAVTGGQFYTTALSIYLIPTDKDGTFDLTMTYGAESQTVEMTGVELVRTGETIAISGDTPAGRMDIDLPQAMLVSDQTEEVTTRGTSPVPGPDVTVSRLGLSSGGSGTDDFANYGASGGIRGYNIASTSCNKGTQTAEWISGSSGRQPVIAGSMYRLLDGRFEQMGMGWLKHSFCAVSEPTCDSCQGTGCSTLGIGCADTYWATLNGDVSRMGPRAQINPWPAVGTPTHTGGSPAPQGGGLRGQVQVYESDIDAGGMWVAEVLYITHDEPFENRYNNASWRWVQFSGAADSIVGMSNNGMPASTQASVNFRESAIMAWQQEDPAVQIFAVDAPSDGRFWLGVRVYDNGDGTYDYEYALQNMNSRKGADAFSVPVDAGVNVTNIGFSDVDYHSGDGFNNVTRDGTDWAPALSGGGGALRWDVVPASPIQNSNALLWGTLYNFRFTADVAPMDGDIDISLFEGGSSNEDVSVSGVPVPGIVPVLCGGDANGDGNTDSADLSVVIGNFGSAVKRPGTDGDVNGDGFVDAADLSVLIGDFGCSEK